MHTPKNHGKLTVRGGGVSTLMVSLTVKYPTLVMHLLVGGNTSYALNKYNFLQWEVVGNDRGAGGGGIVAQSRTNASTDSISNPL